MPHTGKRSWLAVLWASVAGDSSVPLSRKAVGAIATVVVVACTVLATVLGAVFRTPVLKSADAIFGITDFFADRIQARTSNDIDAGYSQFYHWRSTAAQPTYVLDFYAEPLQRVTVTVTGRVLYRSDSLPITAVVDDNPIAFDIPINWLEAKDVTSLLRFGRGPRDIHSVRLVPDTSLKADQEAFVNLVVLVYRKSPSLHSAGEP